MDQRYEPSRRPTFELGENIPISEHLLPQRPSVIHATADGGTAEREPDTGGEWTERHTVRRQYLSIFEAASLIVNKMIGTGIFTTPGLILYLTQSKSLALGLWIIGGVYAAVCLLVYLDYGTSLPFNGAELVYLTRVYQTARLRMLPAILFSSFFICLYHTAGNAISFARFVVIAGSSANGNGQYHPHGILVKSFAILALAVVCFLLWVSPKSGLVLSKTIAMYKILLLLILGFWGISKRFSGNSDNYFPTEDWGYQERPQPRNSLQRLSGFIYVAYSYNGWENACYVLGQLNKSHPKWRQKIRWGAIVAVILVSFAYSILTLGFYLACTYDDIWHNVDNSSDMGITQAFSNRVVHNADALAINIAFSALGNLVAVAYTSTKVKQAIALHHFIPFSTFVGSDAPFDTPGGALLLHWIISSIFILATPATGDGYTFLIGLVTYGQLIVAFFVGIGRLRLEDTVRKAGLYAQGWAPWVPSRIVNYSAGIALASVNIMVVITAAWPIDDKNIKIPRYLWPAVLGSLLAFGFVYWSVLNLLQGRFGCLVGWEWRIVRTSEEDDLDHYRRMTRRDGTEDRYVYNLVKNGPADKVRKGWKKFWGYLEDTL